MSQLTNTVSCEENESSETSNEVIKCPICDCHLEKNELQAHLEIEIHKLDISLRSDLDQYRDEEFLLDNTHFEPIVVDEEALSDIFKEVQLNRLRRSTQKKKGVCLTCYQLENKINEDYWYDINTDKDLSNGYDSDNKSDTSKTYETDSLEYDEPVKANEKQDTKNRYCNLRSTNNVSTNKDDPKIVFINNTYLDEKLECSSDDTTDSNVKNYNFNDNNKRQLLKPTLTSFNSKCGVLETVKSKYEDLINCDDSVLTKLPNLGRYKENTKEDTYFQKQSVSLNELQNFASYKSNNDYSENILLIPPSSNYTINLHSNKIKGKVKSCSNRRHSETDILNNEYSFGNSEYNTRNNVSCHKDCNFNKSETKLKSPILLNHQYTYIKSNHHSQSKLQATSENNNDKNSGENSASSPIINEYEIDRVTNSQRKSVPLNECQNNNIDSLHILHNNFDYNENKPQTPILFTINDSNTGTEKNKYLDIYSTGYPPMCIIINHQIKLTLRNWNCIIGPKKNMFCLLCQKPVNQVTHTKEKHHEYRMALKKRKILSEFHYSIITELLEPDAYHCGTCNKLLNGIDNVRKHCEDHIHLVLNEDFKRKAQELIEKLLNKERKEKYPSAMFSSITNNETKAVVKPICALEHSTLRRQGENINCNKEEEIMEYDENESKRLGKDKNEIDFNDDKENIKANLNSTDSKDNCYEAHNITTDSDAEKYLHIFSIETFSGYIINRKIRLSTKNWNCITGVKRHLYCNICQKDIKSKGKHKNEQNHLFMMQIKNRRILLEFEYSIISEIPMKSVYHCGVCNVILQELFAVRQHCKEEKHTQAKNKCLTSESTARAKRLEQQAKLYEKFRPKAHKLRNDEHKTFIDNYNLDNKDNEEKQQDSVDDLPQYLNNTDTDFTKNTNSVANYVIVDDSPEEIHENVNEVLEALIKIEKNNVYDYSEQTQNKYVNVLDTLDESEFNVKNNDCMPQLMIANPESMTRHRTGKYMFVHSVEKFATFIINRQASLTSRKWNCITGTNNNPFCSLCRLKPPYHYLHIKEEKHLALMEQKKNRILSEFDYSIISKMPIPDTYHCGTCNIELQGLCNVRLHCSTSRHIKSKKTQMVSAQNQIDGVSKTEQQNSKLIDMLDKNSEVSVDSNSSVSDVELSSVVFSNSQQSIRSVDKIYMSTFNIERLPYHYLIDKKVMVSFKAWNCILGVADVNFCTLCKTDVPDKKLHVENEKHGVFMKEKNKKILSQFDYDIVSELPATNTYHCAMCNIVVTGSFYIVNHCKEDGHLGNREKSLKLAQKYLSRQTKKCKDTFSPSIVQSQTNSNSCGLIENEKGAIDITEIKKMLTADTPFMYSSCVQERLVENLPINKIPGNNTIEVPLFNLTTKPLDIFCHGPCYSEGNTNERNNLIEYEIYASQINIDEFTKKFDQMTIDQGIETGSFSTERIRDGISVYKENNEDTESDIKIKNFKDANDNHEIEVEFHEVENCNEEIESASSISTELLKQSSTHKDIFLKVFVQRKSGFIINNEVHLPARNWNSVTGTKMRLHCELCDMFFIKNQMYFHVNKEEHQLRLKSKEKKIMAEFGYSLVSETSIPGTYHCSVCNITANNLLLMDIHCDSNEHRTCLEERRKRCLNMIGRKYHGPCYDESNSNKKSDFLEYKICASPLATTSQTNSDDITNTLNQLAIGHEIVARSLNAEQIYDGITSCKDIMCENTNSDTDIEDSKDVNKKYAIESDSCEVENHNEEIESESVSSISTELLKECNKNADIYLNVFVQLKSGYIINNEINLPTMYWNFITGTRRSLHCGLCNKFLLRNKMLFHINEQEHQLKLKSKEKKILAEFGYSLVSETSIPGTYHCSVCNITANNLLLMDIHCDSNEHRAQLEESRKRCANILGIKSNKISLHQVPSISNISISESKPIVEESPVDTSTLRFDAKQNPPITINIKRKYLPLKITSLHYVLGQGVLINNKVTTTSRGWHGCYDSRRRLHCTVCGVVISIHEFTEHSTESSHLDNVKMYPFLEEYGTDLIKKVRSDRYYCGICNCIIKPFQFETHVFSQNHILKYNLAVKSANYIRSNMAKLEIHAMDF